MITRVIFILNDSNSLKCKYMNKIKGKLKQISLILCKIRFYSCKLELEIQWYVDFINDFKTFQSTHCLCHSSRYVSSSTPSQTCCCMLWVTVTTTAVIFCFSSTRLVGIGGHRLVTSKTKGKNCLGSDQVSITVISKWK